MITLACTILLAIDGDSIRCDGVNMRDMGPGEPFKSGYDAPEIRNAKCERERLLGHQAKLRDAIDKRDTIIAYCDASYCHHHGILDLIALRDRFGPDHGAMARDLVPKLRCTKCKAKGIGRRGREVSIRLEQYDWHGVMMRW